MKYKVQRKYDFSDHLFRCSSLGSIMTGAKPRLTPTQEKELERLDLKRRDGTLTPKQTITLGELLDKKQTEPKLSQTVTSALDEILKEHVFGKVSDLDNKFLQKGLLVEEAAISLYSRVTDTLFIKNKERKNNGLISGECDNCEGMIRDIKSSWSLSTFPMMETSCPSNAYYWQLQGYMELWNLDTAELVYCLVDTPEMLIEDEKRRTCWKLGYIDLPDEVSEAIENNMTFSDIPEALRVKVFRIERDLMAPEMMAQRIAKCREYLNERVAAIAEMLPELQAEKS